MSPDHRHTREEERRIRDAALDQTVAATFPASDPPSSLPNPDDDDAPVRGPAPPPPDDHEGATEEQVGDRTGSGAGHDLDSPVDPDVTSSR